MLYFRTIAINKVSKWFPVHQHTKYSIITCPCEKAEQFIVSFLINCKRKCEAVSRTGTSPPQLSIVSPFIFKHLHILNLQGAASHFYLAGHCLCFYCRLQ